MLKRNPERNGKKGVVNGSLTSPVTALVLTCTNLPCKATQTVARDHSRTLGIEKKIRTVKLAHKQSVGVTVRPVFLFECRAVMVGNGRNK